MEKVAGFSNPTSVAQQSSELPKTIFGLEITQSVGNHSWGKFDNIQAGGVINAM